MTALLLAAKAVAVWFSPRMNEIAQEGPKYQPCEETAHVGEAHAVTPPLCSPVHRDVQIGGGGGAVGGAYAAFLLINFQAQQEKL